MNGRLNDSSMGQGSAATLGLVLLGWFGAQTLALDIADRISSLTGSEVMHRHHYADTVATVLLVGAAALLLGAALRPRLPGRTSPALASRLGSTRISPAVLATLLLTAAETSDLALLAHHHTWPVIVLLIVVALLQGVAALAIAYGWSAVMRSIMRWRALSHVAEQRGERPRAAVATRAYGLQPVHWIGTLTPERAPPGVSA